MCIKVLFNVFYSRVLNKPTLTCHLEETCHPKIVFCKKCSGGNIKENIQSFQLPDNFLLSVFLYSQFMAIVSWKDKQIFSEEPQILTTNLTVSGRTFQRGLQMLQFQTVNWYQLATKQPRSSFYLHMFVDFYFSIPLPFPGSNLLLLCSSVQGHCCKAVWIWNHIKGGTLQSLLDYSGMWLKWFVHDHIISTNTGSWQGDARFCWSNSDVKLYLLKAATALIILFRADLGKQITWSNWKRITTFYCCAGRQLHFFKPSVHFLALHYILEYANVFLKVSEI